MSKSSRRRARAKVRKQVAQRTRVVPATATKLHAVRTTRAAARKVEPRTGTLARAGIEASRPGFADAAHAVLWRTGMLNVAAIARRELGAVFVSPMGWVVAGVFTFLVSGFGFIGTVLAGQQATMDGVFGIITGLLTLILVPVVTMRLIAEERSQGTLELLLTSPVRDWELVVGKWLGAFVFYLLLVATTLVYVVLLAVYLPDKTTFSVAGLSIHVGALDFGLIAATYFGLVVVGAAAIAIGVLASSVTKNQIIAYVGSLFALLAIWYTAFLLARFTRPPLSLFFDYVAGYFRYQSFSLGQVALRDGVYFASLAIGALFLTTRLLESRRWR
ncbi:MAG TPA: ABC transporter permease subunit [Candidatus Dormibacteraeota bacterium]